MEHPKAIGDRTALAVMLALQEAGFSVLVPFGENTRYDLVIDDGVRLARVQCKTGRLRQGAVRFAVCSTYGHHPNPRVVRRDYRDEVTFSPSTVPKRMASISFRSTAFHRGAKVHCGLSRRRTTSGCASASPPTTRSARSRSARSPPASG
ncbi:MAG: hypothetical protein H0U03_03960 [Actinobacteria bacterium]|nr:hypothetical protein [Actinomycetota bacterium]